jgi:hypothetical protein
MRLRPRWELLVIFTAVPLIALVFTGIFCALELSNTEDHFEVTTGSTELTFWDLYYFSLGALTTSGTGDIIPQTTAARLWVTLERLLGVGALVFVVAHYANTQGQSRMKGG